jgi:hypothetical protein
MHEPINAPTHVGLTLVKPAVEQHATGDDVSVRDLDAIVAQIRWHGARMIERLRQTLDEAREIGGLLIEAKAQVSHGEWLPWLAENVAISERTAQEWMRLAKADPQAIEGADSIGDALEAIASPSKSAASRGFVEAIDRAEVAEIEARRARQQAQQAEVAAQLAEARAASEAREREFAARRDAAQAERNAELIDSTVVDDEIPEPTAPERVLKDVLSVFDIGTGPQPFWPAVLDISNALDYTREVAEHLGYDAKTAAEAARLIKQLETAQRTGTIVIDAARPLITPERLDELRYC